MFSYMNFFQRSYLDVVSCDSISELNLFGSILFRGILYEIGQLNEISRYAHICNSKPFKFYRIFYETRVTLYILDELQTSGYSQPPIPLLPTPPPLLTSQQHTHTHKLDSEGKISIDFKFLENTKQS